jgi:hypothetical protein
MITARVLPGEGELGPPPMAALSTARTSSPEAPVVQRRVAALLPLAPMMLPWLSGLYMSTEYSRAASPLLSVEKYSTRQPVTWATQPARLERNHSSGCWWIVFSCSEVFTRPSHSITCSGVVSEAALWPARHSRGRSGQVAAMGRCPSG